MYKKKIVFVINYFYPDLASTGQLMTELCSELQNDFQITVIAAQPAYAGEEVKNKKLFEKSQLNNIDIIRIRLPKVNKVSKVSRIKYIFSYFLLALLALIRERNVDIIYTISQPPILGGAIGSIGKFLKQSKHIYNIQDFNPEQAAAINYTGNQYIYKIAKGIDKLNCQYANKVVVVGNDMVETLKRRFQGKKIPSFSVINNWTDEEEIIPLVNDTTEVSEFKVKHNLINKFVIMYSGNLGLYYDLENIITISNEFKDIEDIVFVYIGEGAMKKKMQEYAIEHNFNNVLFLPYQPKKFVKYSLNAADLHLVVNQKGIKGISVPSKIYGVMAAGKPILGVLEQGSEAERLIKNSQSGYVVEPQDYKGMIRLINHFYHLERNELKKIGLNGRDYLEKYLRKDRSINKYKELLHSL